MLQALSIHNFKSWESVSDLRLANISGFFGTNSSGKTSLLQLILLLKQTAEASDRSLPLDLGDEKSLVELGTFKDVLHRHDLSRTLSWSIRWQLANALRVEDPEQAGATLFEGRDVTQTAEVAWRNSSGPGRMFTRAVSYGFAGHKFSLRESSRRNAYELFAEGAGFKFKRAQGRPWPLPAPAKSYGFPDQVRGYFQNAAFLSQLELTFEELLENVYYLGPLREYPKRQYTWAGGSPSDMGRRGERVVDALLASRDRGQTIRFGRGRGATKRTVEEQVASWLKALHLIHDFEVRPVAADSKSYEVVVTRSESSAPVLITDVGFGVSQILPVLTLCYYAPSGAVLIFEQPEIHLHPSVQAGLADVFIHAARVRNVQIIVESHSEHLLRRLQRRIAEAEITPDEMALYFSQSAEGRSQITPLELDEFGSIRNWPRDFFGDELGEMAATQQAILKRKAGRR